MRNAILGLLLLLAINAHAADVIYSDHPCIDHPTFVVETRRSVTSAGEVFMTYSYDEADVYHAPLLASRMSTGPAQARHSHKMVVHWLSLKYNEVVGFPHFSDEED